MTIETHTFARRAGILRAVILCVAGLSVGQFANAQTAASNAPAEFGPWSPTVAGVRARWSSTVASNPTSLRIDLEIENVSDVANPIEIYWVEGAMLMFRLEDESGSAIAHAALGGNEITPPPYWLMLPHAASMRMTVSNGGYQQLPNGVTYLRLPGMQTWIVPPGDRPLYLRATLNAGRGNDGSHRPWQGPIALPRIRAR